MTSKELADWLMSGKVLVSQKEDVAILAQIANIVRASEEGLQRKWLTISEAAQYIGVGKRIVYYWIETGRLPSKRTHGGTHRVNVDDLLVSDWEMRKK